LSDYYPPEPGRKAKRYESRHDILSDAQFIVCTPDIYVAMVSSTHNVCAKDVYVAIVSTIVETRNPEAEIEPGLKLLGPIFDK